MNHPGLTLTLGLVAQLAAGCPLDDKCIADCDSMGGTAAESGDMTDATADGTGTASPACEDALAAADAFLEVNRQCTTVLDCTSVESYCYQGPFDGPCTHTAISASADLDAWNALYAELEGCECGASECGSTTTCDDQGACEEVFDSTVACERYERDAATFIALNNACTTDADCVPVDSLCYPEQMCGSIALNTAADQDDWATLEAYLQGCTVCGADPCGASVSCGPQGRCITAFP